MEHFFKDVVDESYFSFEDLYSRAAKHFPSGSTFVELGVLHGKSLAYLTVECINAGKNNKIYGVDTFDWGANQWEKVHRNLRPIEGRFDLISRPSHLAAKLFADNSVDFLFIDANHSYECVRADIDAWLPKMRFGSWICGHDYDKDSFPGCVQAVWETFGGRLQFSEHTVWECHLEPR